jgi:outer membrane protein assembly factor BamB
MPPSRPRFTRRRLALLVGAVLVLLGGAAAVFVLANQPGDVNNPDVEFTAEPPDTTPAPAPPASTKEDPADSFVWPIYGYSPERRKYLSAPASMRPPFRRIWRFSRRTLLEFSPIIVRKQLFIIGNNGVLYALNKKNGKVQWRRKIGTLAAESPAFADGRVCATVLSRGSGQGGRVACFRAKDGKYAWSKPLPSRAESSPIIAEGRLYFGTENGTVYSMRLSNGAVRWSYHADGAVKGGLALSRGNLYFGDYAGKMYAIRRADGRQVWKVGTSGRKFGLGSGRFYSTPAVAFGRVYIGNTDSFVYSFSATSGRLAWRHGTGGYVYGSPAVAQVAGGRPSVYIGSYDGNFYALDARDGSVIWRHGNGGKISGGATLIGDIVYFSNFGSRTTTGLGARTGHVVFRSRYGAFNPMVSDREWMFQTGHSSLYGLKPISAQGRATAKARAKARAARAKARRAKARAAHRKTRAGRARAKAAARKKARARHARAKAAARKRARARRAKARAAARKKARERRAKRNRR